MQYIHKDHADTLYRQLRLKIAIYNSWTSKTCGFDTAKILIVSCFLVSCIYTSKIIRVLCEIVCLKCHCELNYILC